MPAPGVLTVCWQCAGDIATGDRLADAIAVGLRRPPGRSVTNQRCRLGRSACSSLAPTPRRSGHPRSSRTCTPLPPGRDGAGRSPTARQASPNSASMTTSTGEPSGPSARPPSPGPAERLAWLAEQGVHESPRMSPRGRRGGIAGRGTPLQSLLGLTARLPAKQLPPPLPWHVPELTQATSGLTAPGPGRPRTLVPRPLMFAPFPGQCG